MRTTTQIKNARPRLTERAPVYSRDGNTRIISAPGGLWQYQAKGSDGGARDSDPWMNRGAPTDRGIAMVRLGTSAPARDDTPIGMVNGVLTEPSDD